MNKQFTFHKQHHIRGYNYSSCTSYMLTICVNNKQYVLSTVKQNSDIELPYCELTIYGKIVDMYIRKMFEAFPNTKNDIYVVMPNHIHMLFTIEEPEKTCNKSDQVPRMVRWLKAHITTQLQISIFQKNYYDVIADTDKRFNNCYEYIRNNPAAWFFGHCKEPEPNDK